MSFNPHDPFNDEEFEFEVVDSEDPQQVEDRIQKHIKNKCKLWKK